MFGIDENFSLNITLAKDILREKLYKTSCRCKSCRLENEDAVGLIDRNYFPLGDYDEENNHFIDSFYSTEPRPIFDLSRSKFVKYHHSELQPIENLRFEFLNHGPENVRSSPKGLHGVEFLFRNFPIIWSDFCYLSIAAPRKSGNLAVAFLEHSDGARVSEEDLTENGRYNKVLKSNIKFAFLYRHMEMSENITGFYRGPKQYGNRRAWTEIWKMIKTDPSSISDFIKRLSIETNTDHTDFMRFMKNEVATMYANLRLDEPKVWEEEKTSYIEVVFKFNYWKNTH